MPIAWSVDDTLRPKDRPQARAETMKELCPDAAEDLRPNMPEQPLGKPIQINILVDAVSNHLSYQLA
jgi:hypothetical protein